MKWQFPIVFWEFVKQSRAECWTSFSPYRLRAGQPGTRVYMRFPSGKVWKKGFTVTVLKKRRLLSYPYLKIDIVVFLLLASFFSCSLYHREQLWIFRAVRYLVFFHQGIFSFVIILDKNRNLWILSPPLCLLNNNLNGNTWVNNSEAMKNQRRICIVSFVSSFVGLEAYVAVYENLNRHWYRIQEVNSYILIIHLTT